MYYTVLVRPVYVPNLDNKWGTASNNYTDGLFGMVAKSEVDILSVGYVNNEFRAKFVDFTETIAKGKPQATFACVNTTQKVNSINPLVPDVHYSERQDKPFSLQFQRLEVDLKLNCRFLFFAPWELMGQKNKSYYSPGRRPLYSRGYPKVNFLNS